MSQRVFISSVQREFAKERKALAEYVRKDAILGTVTRDRTILIAGMGTSPAVLTELVRKHLGNLIYFAVETNP